MKLLLTYILIVLSVSAPCYAMNNQNKKYKLPTQQEIYKRLTENGTCLEEYHPETSIVAKILGGKKLSLSKIDIIVTQRLTAHFTAFAPILGYDISIVPSLAHIHKDKVLLEILKDYRQLLAQLKNYPTIS